MSKQNILSHHINIHFKDFFNNICLYTTFYQRRTIKSQRICAHVAHRRHDTANEGTEGRLGLAQAESYLK